MELALRPLRKQDYGKAMRFAIEGMHFNRYMKSQLLLTTYGWFFWYSELQRSSQVIAAYQDDELVGVLLADMKGEPKTNHPFWSRLFVRVFDCIQKTFYKKSYDPYDLVSAEMFEDFSRKYTPDGEVVFLAADLTAGIKGIGTMLLEELERREYGKRIFLYTDHNCNYQFYEHRGFRRMEEKDTTVEVDSAGKVPLCCYLYSKTCGK